MSEDIKKTKGVLRMRDVFEKVILAVEEDTIDVARFAPTTCNNCIHRDRSLEESPCNKCTTAVERHGRDYRPSDYYHWRASEVATAGEIQLYHKEYGVPELRDLLTHLPLRCINPKCAHDFPLVCKRGLCEHCYTILDKCVIKDEAVSEEWLLMYWLCDSEEDRSMILKYYLQLYTWDRFELEGRCLPSEEHATPSRELILYYRQTRTNLARRKNQDPTPTEKQLSKVMTPEQLERTRDYLEVKEKR